MRSGSSTNHIPILRVLRGPTTHSRECSFGAKNSMSPSPRVIIAKASTSLFFHTAPFPPVFVMDCELADSTTLRVRGSAPTPRRYSPKFSRPASWGSTRNAKLGVVPARVGLSAGGRTRRGRLEGTSARTDFCAAETELTNIGDRRWEIGGRKGGKMEACGSPTGPV